jgi:acetolactate decarboxylase
MENKRFLLGIGLAVVLVFCAVSVYAHFAKTTSPPPDYDTLYQVSTIDALLMGVYDGIQPVGELKTHGDFGIGGFDAMDGELILLDGVVYQARADGSIIAVPDNMTTPFASATFFSADHVVTTAHPMNLSEFESTMEQQLPTGNMIYALRMHGTFPQMTVRAIPAQQRPYPPLAKAIENQSVYTYTDTNGTVMGFYTPVFFKGINIPGYHLHYLSDDKKTGGHILDCTVPSRITVEYDVTPGFAMGLPTTGDFTGVDLSKDLSTDLARVEK